MSIDTTIIYSIFGLGDAFCPGDKAPRIDDDDDDDTYYTYERWLDERGECLLGVGVLWGGGMGGVE